MYFRLMGKLNARRKGLLEEGEGGFTLIELLVVVIIIGILAAIAIPVYLGIQDNAKNSAVQSDLTNAKTAIVAYQTKAGGLPDGTTAGQTLSVGDLGTYGFTQSSNTTGIVYKAAPAAGATSFCLIATGATGAKYYATDSLGVSTTAC